MDYTKRKQLNRAWSAFNILRDRRSDIALLCALCPSITQRGIFLSGAEIYISPEGIQIKPDNWYPVQLDFTLLSQEALYQQLSCGTPIDQLADSLEQAISDMDEMESVLYRNLYKKFRKYNPEAFAF
jgi:hypothetical protein